MLIENSRQSRRGSFPKKRLVFAREPPELPKPIPRGDFGDGGLGRISLTQRAPNQVHTAEQQVVFCSHSEMFIATHLEGPQRRTDLLAEFCHVERLVEMVLDDPMKPPHDRGMLSLCRLILFDVAAAEATVMASISACSRPRAACGWLSTSGTSIAKSPSAA
jgi:hypothetical protein